MLKNVNSQIGQGSQNEIAPSKMVRVKLKYGSARVSEDYSKETIDVLNHLSEVVYNRYTEAHGGQLQQHSVVRSCLQEVWQKWCELDNDKFDEWLHAQMKA